MKIFCKSPNIYSYLMEYIMHYQKFSKLFILRSVWLIDTEKNFNNLYEVYHVKDTK